MRQIMRADLGLRVAIVPVTPFQQNCAVIWNPRNMRGAVVDPGGDVEQILAAIDHAGITVERIFLTHGHLDHAGGASALQRALRERLGDESAVPIIGPDRRDAFLLSSISEQARLFGISGLENAAPDRWLTEGEEVDIAGEKFSVIHCPGHTPGHIVFYNAKAGFAIVGDVLFYRSIGRTDFPYGDHEALLRAIHEKLLPLGDDVHFICGHGPGSRFGDERRHNPFLR
jgi:hydroxyacylglutathione hydrolase